MKVITAIVQPFVLGKLTDALEALSGFPGMTVSQVQGLGAGGVIDDEAEQHRAVVDFVAFVRKIRLDIFAADTDVERIVEIILTVAHTGNPGDGKIVITPAERTIRIRTRESGDDALRDRRRERGGS